MRFAEMLGRHASEASLLAIVAGEAASPHVSSCASCQAQLTRLRAWTGDTAAEAAAIADAVFTPDRLASQKSEILRRIEAAGRSARVIAFPLGAPAPALQGARQVAYWIAAAALGGILVGLASGRLLDTHGVPSTGPAAKAQTTTVAPAGQPAGMREDLDEAALLDAAYDRISLESLRTIDDMTPRAREVALASLPRTRR